MKVCVSIPNDVFRAMEAVARWTGKPRTALYTEALRLFIETRGAEAVTAQLNRVYRKTGSQLDPVLSRMQTAAFQKDW
jgi:hypothetical protein